MEYIASQFDSTMRNVRHHGGGTHYRHNSPYLTSINPSPLSPTHNDQLRTYTEVVYKKISSPLINYLKQNSLVLKDSMNGTYELTGVSKYHHQQESTGSENITSTVTYITPSNNSSNNYSSNTPINNESLLSLFSSDYALVLPYSLIILVSLIGNLLVCLVIFGSRDMRTTTNLLIGSLACSDIVMTCKWYWILFSTWLIYCPTFSKCVICLKRCQMFNNNDSIQFNDFCWLVLSIGKSN